MKILSGHTWRPRVKRLRSEVGGDWKAEQEGLGNWIYTLGEVWLSARIGFYDDYVIWYLTRPGKMTRSVTSYEDIKRLLDEPTK